MKFTLSAEETRELRLAVSDRAEKLTKLRKGLEAAQLSTENLDYHLNILLGDDALPGLAGRLSEQLTVFQAQSP